jgi:hypothetical protein
MVATIVGCASEGAEPAPPPEEPGVPPATYELDPPAEGEGFQIDLGKWTIDPGRNGGHCVLVPIPESYGEAPLYLVGSEARFSSATHHYFMSYSTAATVAETTPCNGDSPLSFNDEPKPPPAEGGEPTGTGTEKIHGEEGYKIVLGAGEGAYGYRMPSGYGMLLETGAGHLRSSWHILNTSLEPFEAFGLLNLYTAAPAAIHHPVRSLSCLLVEVYIGAQQKGTVSATCTAPFDLDLVMLASHAHQYLTRFEMRLFDGASTVEPPIYVNTDWDSPKIVALETPIRLKKGQGLTYSCEYFNYESEPLSFGAGVGKEMCATINAYAYPPERPGELPPSLGALALFDGGSTELVDTSEVPLPF